MQTISEMIDSIESAKENCRIIGEEFTPRYLAYWVSCSERHAERMIQYAEGAKINQERNARLEAISKS